MEKVLSRVPLRGGWDNRYEPATQVRRREIKSEEADKEERKCRRKRACRPGTRQSKTWSSGSKRNVPPEESVRRRGSLLQTGRTIRYPDLDERLGSKPECAQERVL